MKRYPIYLLAAGLLLLCFGCFSPWKGAEDEAAFTINLDGGSGRMAYPPAPIGANYPNLADLKFVIQFTSVQGGQGKTFVKDGLFVPVITDKIIRGVYNVNLEIFLLDSPDEHYASGSLVSGPVTLSEGNTVINIEVKEVWKQGDGTPGNPFKVYDVPSLKKVGTGTPGDWGLSDHYKMIRNIDMTGVTGFTPIGTNPVGNQFIGNFNGNGKTINLGNSVVGRNGNYSGLFGYIGSGGEVKNLSLVGSITVSGIWTGAVAGCNEGIIENIFASVTFLSVSSISGSVRAGGIVGSNTNGTIKNGALFVDITAQSINNSAYVGGIAGQLGGGSIENCYSIGSCTAKGIAGYDSCAGGIVGHCGSGGGVVTNCWAGGVLTADTGSTRYVGGIIGYNFSYATITNSVALHSAITSAGGHAGRITGGNPYGNNNYAISSMIVNGALAVGGLATNENGEYLTVTSPNGGYNNPSFWQNTMGFSSVYWEFRNGPPILKNMPGNYPQNPVVP